MEWNITSVRYEDELKKRIEEQLLATESISQFFHKAGLEKVNRMERRNEQERRRQMLKDYQALKPVIEMMKERGEI